MTDPTPAAPAPEPPYTAADEMAEIKADADVMAAIQREYTGIGKMVSLDDVRRRLAIESSPAPEPPPVPDLWYVNGHELHFGDRHGQISTAELALHVAGAHNVTACRLAAAEARARELEADRDRLRREILAAGTSQSFDWAILERLDRLETAEADRDALEAKVKDLEERIKIMYTGDR